MLFFAMQGLSGQGASETKFNILLLLIVRMTFFNSALRSLPVLFPGKSNNKIIDNNPPARLVIFLGMQRETNN